MTDLVDNRGDVDDDEDTVPGRSIRLTVNGRRRKVDIKDRELLVEVIREQCGLTGTHIGCYNGDCGACTVRVDGEISKSCVVLAASVDGSEITTIEALGGDNGALDEVQRAFWDNDAFQCGFCLPGHLFAVEQLLDDEPSPTEDDVRDALVGNLCRCTGYVNLVRATLDAAERRRGAAPADTPRGSTDTDVNTLHH